MHSFIIHSNCDDVRVNKLILKKADISIGYGYSWPTHQVSMTSLVMEFLIRWGRPWVLNFYINQIISNMHLLYTIIYTI